MEKGTSAAMWPMLAAVTASVPPSLTKSAAPVMVNGLETKALVDSGSSESFIHPRLVKPAALCVYPYLLALFLFIIFIVKIYLSLINDKFHLFSELKSYVV